jgi:NADH-quinone oxidoreductase subunit C
MDNTQLKEWVSGIEPDATFEETPQFLAVTVAPDKALGLLKKLREEPETSFDFLMNITGADWNNKLMVIYHLESLKHGHRIEVKTGTEDRENAQLDSICSIFKGAEMHEDEIYDLLGITFRGHPNLRRMFMPDDWKGFPLRKDYVDEVNIVDLT